jgi:CRP-like cAMP-binding protein
MPMEKVTFFKNQVIMQEGEPGDVAYMILSGEVQVLKKNQWGKDVLITRLGPEEMIGEMCLFEEECARSATVIAFTDLVNTVRIPKEMFVHHMDQLPPEVRQVIQVLLMRLRKSSARISFLS